MSENKILDKDIENLDNMPRDEVFDECDQAQWLNLQEIAQSAKLARERSAPETHPEFDGVHCVDCDIEIPAQRLALHKVRCVHCQEDLEKYR